MVSEARPGHDATPARRRRFGGTGKSSRADCAIHTNLFEIEEMRRTVTLPPKVFCCPPAARGEGARKAWELFCVFRADVMCAPLRPPKRRAAQLRGATQHPPATDQKTSGSLRHICVP